MPSRSPVILYRPRIKSTQKSSKGESKKLDENEVLRLGSIDHNDAVSVSDGVSEWKSVANAADEREKAIALFGWQDGSAVFVCLSTCTLVLL
ncbi:hypothetical protein PSPO01_02651 [Paraphaeosphaeria sporulosa]